MEWLKEIIENIFKKKEGLSTYILVSETKRGIETYVNPQIDKFPNAYKKQIISFLNGAIKTLEKKETKK